MWLLVFIACAGKETGGDTAAVPTEGELRTLTYNVHGLPAQITGDDTAGRMVQIAPLLQDFDLIGLQEDFDDANHDALVAETTHSTRERFSEKLDDRAYGPGLAMLAHAPTTTTYEHHYTTCVGVLDSSSDCLASKGFHVIRLQLGAGELDVYNTHHEAGGGEDDNASRLTQAGELTAAMQDFSAGRAILFMGDTNLHGDDPDDRPPLELYTENAGLSEVCELVDCAEPGRIDRIYVRDGDGIQLEALDWEVVPGWVDAQGVPLSDHDPIAATIRWSTP